jgi:hypothetical protein
MRYKSIKFTNIIKIIFKIKIIQYLMSQLDIGFPGRETYTIERDYLMAI